MLTKRRVTALLAALACGITWVVFVAPGGAGHAAPPIGTTVRASVADDGSEAQYGGGDSQISGNGRFDIFTSYSSLASGPGNGTHFDDSDSCSCQDLNSAIYVRDLATGHTSQVSIGYSIRDDSTGTKVVDQPDNNSFSPSISANGRYVSFVTDADNVVATNNTSGSSRSIIVCDRGKPDASGGFAATRGAGEVYPARFQCVSVSSDGSGSSNPLGIPHLDGAGNELVWVERNQSLRGFHTIGWVAMIFHANGQLNTPEDSEVMPFPTTALGFDGSVEPQQAQVSPDGEWVVFAAVPTTDDEANGYGTPEAIVEWRFDTLLSPRRVDVNPSDDYIGNSDFPVGNPDVSNGGTTVVFDVSNFGGYYSYPDVYAVTVDTSRFSTDDVVDPTTSSVVVSRVPDGTPQGAGGDGAYPTVSADGRYVGFVTDRPGMFDTPDENDADNTASCLTNEFSSAPPTTGVDGAAAQPNAAAPRSTSVGSAPAGSGPPSSAPSGPPASSSTTPSAAASAGASRQAVQRPAAQPPSGSGNPSGGGDRSSCQIAVRDLVADRAALAAKKSFALAHLASPSINNNCEPATGQECAGNADSENPVSLSDNGAQVGFDSAASDLVPNDTNAPVDGGPTNDAFVRTWTPTLKVGTIDFGSVQIGHPSDQSLPVTVVGFGPIPIGTSTIGGDDPGDFTIPSSTCTNTTLHEPDSCVVTVEFGPTVPGTRDGTVSVLPPPSLLVPDPGPITTVPVTGTGTKKSVPPPPPPDRTPKFHNDPATLYFGSDIPLHTPGVSRTVTISNPGTAKLVLTHISIVAGTVPGSSGDFTVTTPSCASGIPPGGSCTITLTFIGRAVGPRNAVLLIADNTGTPAHVIPLGARIRAPQITVNPAVSPTGRVVTVTGTGFAPKRVVDLGFLQSGEETLVKADKSGHFSVGLVIFPNADEGPRTITARTVKVNPSISAVTPLLVVLGTLESPTLVIRH